MIVVMSVGNNAEDNNDYDDCGKDAAEEGR